MKVLIDNGHGETTPGKCSPDKRLKEWAYTREIADMVVTGLRRLGIDAERIVKEDSDVPLSERCKRANAIYKETGKKAILISIHCNAAGSGASWMGARGWSVFVSNNASTNSKKLAECLAKVTKDIPLPVRKPNPNQLYWEQNLAMCRDTNCPAVLTENFFQNNKIGWIIFAIVAVCVMLYCKFGKSVGHIPDFRKSFSVFALIVYAIIILVCCSCRTQYVPVETVRTEYKTRDSIRFDSIYQRDSVYMYQKGDSVYLYKYKYLYRYLTINKTDTVIKTDSIQVPYPFEKELSR